MCIDTQTDILGFYDSLPASVIRLLGVWVPVMHRTPTSSVCTQLCVIDDVQSINLGSVPRQLTSSSKIIPVPASTLVKETAPILSVSLKSLEYKF